VCSKWEMRSLALGLCLKELERELELEFRGEVAMEDTSFCLRDCMGDV